MKTMTDSMYELERILRTHGQQYPAMQPADAIKLIYQNEFGGGHLIKDTESCRNYLRREYAAVEKDPAAVRCDEIGNGIVRVNLAAMQEEDLQWLGTAFIRSAAEHQGDMRSFLQKLKVLKMLVEQGAFSFDSAELERYLLEYEKAGYPAVSHSQAYREAYRPAYRVILADLLCDEK